MSVIDVDALRESSRADLELDPLRRQRTTAARRRGTTWEQIGESVGMSQRSAWEQYTRQTRHVLAETAIGSALNEDEAMRVATDEVNRAQRRRRSAEP